MKSRNTRSRRRAFTMAEVLVSVFVLGIGLVMLAAIFPVAGDWTRQSSEESTATMIGQTAISVIQARYTAADLTSVTENVDVLPNIGTRVSWQMRAYSADTTEVWPTTRNPPPHYSWMALIRRTPGQFSGMDNRFDVYVLISKRGEVSHTFNTSTTAAGRGSGDPRDGSNRFYMPRLERVAQGTVAPGARGVTQLTGLVTRKLSAANDFSVAPQSGEEIWWVPPPDQGTNAGSPLVYVYQTTLSF